MSHRKSLGIVWYRRDLRVKDHIGLSSVDAKVRSIVPVYFVSQWQRNHLWTGPNRQQFLCESIASLDANLRHLGGRLIVRHESVLDGLRKLIIETGASCLAYQKDPDPYGHALERDVDELCQRLGVEVISYHDVSMHAPDVVRTGDGMPYRVYTPFSKNWMTQEKLGVTPSLTNLHTPEDIPSEPLPTLAHWHLPAAASGILQGGEKAARERMKRSIKAIVSNYKLNRDIPSLDGTSRLSQDLRFGLISIRELYARVMAEEEAAPAGQREGFFTYRKELAWREFYFAILRHFPEVLEHEFQPQWRGLAWDEPDEKWEAWKMGRTGFPIVDAGMRELLATGNMHNRVRMIVAMFLTKDLHYDWRLGESWFLQHLVDGEIASNNGGWQWSAGTGADAAPYFRIQNPWSQTARYDPQGIYIKRWVPELANVAPERFLSPPATGLPVASGYVSPILEHSRERDKTMAIFKAHKENIR